MTSAVVNSLEVTYDNLVLPVNTIEDLTPYDVYATLTVKDSAPAEHVNNLSNALMDTILDDDSKDRLCIVQPPRTAKSSLITLSFPFWLILMNPELNILVVNYNKELANDFGVVLRQLFIDNQELLAGRDIYLSNVEHAKASFRFENSKGELLGSIKLVGVGGTITGRDVDICICDDLIKGFVDCTQTLLNKLYEWFKNILIPRLEPHSKLFILGTRWHTQDIIGRLKEEHSDRYDFIELKAINDDGTCIWPNRYTPEFFEERRHEVGDRVFEAQYQGQPLDETGDFFNIDKLFFEDDYDPNTAHIKAIVRSWDLAYSDESKGQKNDSTAGILMYRTYDDRYIISGLEYGQYGDQLISHIKTTAMADSPRVKILIETGTKGGAAKFLYDEYAEKLTGYNVEQSEPIGSKVDRATPFRNAMDAGKIGVVLGDEMRGKLLEQLKSFPLGAHDDIVDACSYAYSELQKQGGNKVKTAAKRKRRRMR